MTPEGVGTGDNLVLIGPMGSGKSSIARELARLTNRRWIDTDKQVVGQSGLTITEIFAQRGEDHFRQLETAALRSLLNEQRLIVATGGGIVTREENRAWLRALGCVVFLTASEGVLFERVSRNRQRPLLQTENPRAALAELVRSRDPLYKECAHFSVDTSVGSHADIAQSVLTRSRQYFTEIGLASSLP